MGDEQFYGAGTDPTQKILPPQDYSLTFINPQFTYLVLLEHPLGAGVESGWRTCGTQDAIDVSGKRVDPSEAQRQAFI